MRPDEIDLSAYPSYLGRHPDPASKGSDMSTEGVVRGLVRAALAGLVGVGLGLVVTRVGFVSMSGGMFTGALTSAAMVLLYTRGAGAAPRRGLVPLILLHLIVLVTTFTAVLISRAWWVYTLLDTELGGMPPSRSNFVWSTVVAQQNPGYFWRSMLLLTLYSISGSCLALWWVWRRARLSEDQQH